MRHSAERGRRSVGERVHHRRVVVDHFGSAESQTERCRHGVAASMSRSYSTSRWSAVKPCGTTTTPSAAPGRGEVVDDREDVGAAPGFGRPAGALPCDAPVGPPAQPTAARRSPRPIRRAGRDTGRLPSTRSGNEWAVNNTLVRSGIAASAGGQCRGLVGDELVRGRTSCRPRRMQRRPLPPRRRRACVVLADREAGVVRGQHDVRRSTSAPAATRASTPSSMNGAACFWPRCDDVAPGHPVPSSQRRASASMAARWASVRAASGRDAADRLVAGDQVGQLMRLGRATPTDVGVIRLDVVGRRPVCRRPSPTTPSGRGAHRVLPWAGCSWIQPTSCSRTPGSVSGSTP